MVPAANLRRQRQQQSALAILGCCHPSEPPADAPEPALSSHRFGEGSCPLRPRHRCRGSVGEEGAQAAGIIDRAGTVVPYCLQQRRVRIKYLAMAVDQHRQRQGRENGRVDTLPRLRPDISAKSPAGASAAVVSVDSSIAFAACWGSNPGPTTSASGIVAFAADRLWCDRLLGFMHGRLRLGVPASSSDCRPALPGATFRQFRGTHCARHR